MLSPALRSRTVPSLNRQVTDSSPERLHTTNTVQALMEAEKRRLLREETGSPARRCFALRLGVGRAKVPEFLLFWFKFTPFPVLVVVALDGMDMSKCPFLFPPPPEVLSGESKARRA